MAQELVMSACPSCHDTFPSPDGLQEHMRISHVGSINFELSGLQYSLLPSSEGGFKCPCGHHIQDTVYPSVMELVAHIKFIRKWEDPPPPEAIVLLSEHLVDSPSLVRYSLAINLQHQFLICTSCGVIVVPINLPAHMRHKHEQSIRPKDMLAMRKLWDYLAIPLHTFIPNFKPPTPEIDGLPVFEGLQCSCCSSCYVKLESMRKHFRDLHPGEPFPSSFQSVPVQRLNEGIHKSYFPVVPLSHPRTSFETFMGAVSRCYPALPSCPESEPSADARSLSPWLRHTRWHDLLTQHGAEELRLLAVLPRPLEFPSLQVSVVSFFLQASDLIDQTSTLVLQKLHSPLPSQEIVNTPFHHLQDHAQRLRSYVLPVVGLLAMLLRGAPIPLPSDIENAVEALRAALGTGSEGEITPKLVFLLRALWETVWLPTEHHRVTDPTILYLALSSIQPQGSFKEPKLITNVIARLEYAMRLFMLTEIHTVADHEQGYDHYRRWISEKIESTFNTLRTLQHLASSIAFSTMSLPKVYWTDRKTFRAMLYKGSSITMERLQDMLQALEADIVQIWEKDLLFSLDLTVRYDAIHDDLSNMQPGYGFWTDRRNSCFADAHSFIRAVYGTPHLRKHFISLERDGVVIWNTHNLRSWLAQYAKFHLYLMTRIHLTAGAPSRGTELTLMQALNTVDYPIRNLVAMNKHIALLVTYVKTSSVSGHDRLIPHSLDAFTSDLVIQDLAIARPFARLAARICHSNRPEVVRLYDSHLFINHVKPFTTEDITESLKSLSAVHFDESFGVNGWRHISTAFRRMLCSRVLELAESQENDTIQALQSGHRRATENRVYGISTDGLAGAAEDVLPLFLDASTDWQIECRVVPGGTLLPYRQARMSACGERPAPPPDYEPDTNRPILSMIHAITDTLTSIQQKVESLGTSSHPEPQKSNAPDLLTLLRTTLKSPSATWTSPEQLKAIQTLLELQHDVLVVLPTGSGKTMIAVLPALAEKNKITVIILPLRALMMDYVLKLTQMDIPFEVFDSTTPLTGKTNIILVSADAVKTTGWKQAISEIHERTPVTRQIFDETHIPPMQSDFRPALRHMSDIRCPFSTQLVLLSATVPLNMEAHLRDDFGLEPGAVVIRTRTNRPELSYSWLKPCQEMDALETVKGLIAQHILRREDRALVFVPFLDIGKAVSERLNYPFYHGSDGLDDNQRLTLFSEWKEGIQPIMICTSAFGTGNDHPHVRLVIHLGTPFGMLDYTQEVSRGGRDRKPATCVLIPNRIVPPKIEKDDLSGKRYIYDNLVNPTKCLRFIITFFNDGVGTRCEDEANNQPCSVCELPRKRSLDSAFDEATVASRKRYRDRNVASLEYVSNFKEQLSRYQNTCTFCLACGIPSDHYHSVLQCPTLRDMGGFDTFKAWKKGIVYRDSGICFKCHVPNGPHDSLHPAFSSANPCEYSDLIAPLVYGVLLHPRLRENVSSHFGVPLENPTQALPWIKGASVQGHLSNMTAIFLWYKTPLSVSLTSAASLGFLLPFFLTIMPHSDEPRRLAPDSSDDRLPDGYDPSKNQIVFPTDVSRGGKKKKPPPPAPDDANHVVGLYEQVNDAFIGYFKMNFGDNDFFGRGPKITRHSSNTREPTSKSLLDLRRALGANTNDPTVPFERIARYQPRHATNCFLDPAIVKPESISRESYLPKGEEYPKVVWTEDAVKSTVQVANGNHRRTLMYDLSKEPRAKLKTVKEALQLTPQRDQFTRAQYKAQIRELEEEIEIRSSWLVAAYDINKVTPEIAQFLSMNSNFYQALDSEMNQLQMILAYIAQQPVEDQEDVILQGRSPAGWAIPFPISTRLRSALGEVNLIKTLLASQPYLREWIGQGGLTVTGLLSWKGSPAPFMEQFIQQMTLTLNYLSSGLKPPVEMNQATMLSYRKELNKNRPVSIPNLLDEEFFSISQDTYLEFLERVQSSYGIAENQVKDRHAWKNAFNAYSEAIRTRLAAWANVRLTQVSSLDTDAIQAMRGFKERLDWVLKGLFNHVYFGLHFKGCFQPIACAAFLLYLSRSLTSIAGWLDVVLQWIEPFHRLTFSSHSGLGTSELLMDCLSRWTNRPNMSIERWLRHLLSVIFGHHTLAFILMLNADQKAQPWVRSFSLKNMDEEDPSRSWSAHAEELAAVLREWRKRSTRYSQPLLMEHLPANQLAILTKWKDEIDFSAILTTTGLAWANCPASNVTHHMKGIATHLIHLAWVRIHHQPKYTRILSFWDLRRDISKSMGEGREKTDAAWSFWDGDGIEPSHQDMVDPPSSQGDFTPRVRVGHRVKALNIMTETRSAVKTIVSLLSSPNVGAIPNPNSDHPLYQHLPHEDVYEAAKVLFEKLAVASHHAKSIYLDPMGDRLEHVSREDVQRYYRALEVPPMFKAASHESVKTYYTKITFEELNEIEALDEISSANVRREAIRRRYAESKRSSRTLAPLNKGKQRAATPESEEGPTPTPPARKESPCLTSASMSTLVHGPPHSASVAPAATSPTKEPSASRAPAAMSPTKEPSASRAPASASPSTLASTVMRLEPSVPVSAPSQTGNKPSTSSEAGPALKKKKRKRADEAGPPDQPPRKKHNTPSHSNPASDDMPVVHPQPVVEGLSASIIGGSVGASASAAQPMYVNPHDLLKVHGQGPVEPSADESHRPLGHPEGSFSLPACELDFAALPWADFGMLDQPMPRDFESELAELFAGESPPRSFTSSERSAMSPIEDTSGLMPFIQQPILQPPPSASPRRTHEEGVYFSF